MLRASSACLMLGAFGATGCGDIGSISLDLMWASDDLEERTGAIEVLIREPVGPGIDGCMFVNTPPPGGLRQTDVTLNYPFRTDLLVSPVGLDFPSLTLIVSAHVGSRVVQPDDPDAEMGQTEAELRPVGMAFAVGCQDQPIEDADASIEVPIMLNPVP